MEEGFRSAFEGFIWGKASTLVLSVADAAAALAAYRVFGTLLVHDELHGYGAHIAGAVDYVA